MRNALTGLRFLRLSRNRCSPWKAAESGSGPRFPSRLWVSPSGCQSRQPKRRGSLKRSSWPESRVISTWSCLPAGRSGSSTRRLPDMPRCSRALPFARSSSRYLARRRTPRMTCPGSLWLISGGIGQRRSGRRKVTPVIRRPSRWGVRPRRMVSTSGSSGMPPACPSFVAVGNLSPHHGRPLSGTPRPGQGEQPGNPMPIGFVGRAKGAL